MALIATSEIMVVQLGLLMMPLFHSTSSGLISGNICEIHGRQVISYDIEIDRFLCDLREQEEAIEGDEYD